MKRKKLTKAEREARDAERARVLANAQRTRDLAERALARREPENLPPFKLHPTRAERAAERERMRANAQRTRELAERAQAKLDAQRPAD
jgi:hypothetical protein